MGRDVSADVVKLFETRVHHVFQPMVDDIRSRVRMTSGEKGKTVQFPVLGKSVSVPRTNFGTSIPVGNQSHNPVTLTVLEYTCAEYTDVFLQDQINYDEQEALVYSVTMAMQRRMLQLVIDGLNAASIANTVAKNVTGSNDNLNTKMLKEARRKIVKVGTPKDNLTFMAHVNGTSYLASDPKVGSLDYNTLRTMLTGDVGTLYGFSFYEVPDLPDEGGLTLSTNDRTNYAFHKQAIGMAVNKEPRVEVWYDGDKGYHKVTGFLCAGAVVIDPLGVCKVTTDESVV